MQKIHLLEVLTSAGQSLGFLNTIFCCSDKQSDDFVQGKSGHWLWLEEADVVWLLMMQILLLATLRCESSKSLSIVWNLLYNLSGDGVHLMLASILAKRQIDSSPDSPALHSSVDQRHCLGRLKLARLKLCSMFVCTISSDRAMWHCFNQLISFCKYPVLTDVRMGSSSSWWNIWWIKEGLSQERKACVPCR